MLDQQGQRRTRSRTLSAGLAAVAIAVLAAPAQAAARASSQEPDHAQTAPSSFILGSASALAQAVRIVPAIGSFQAAVTLGTSIAGYNNSEGQASAKNLDLGALGTDLTGPQCDGSNPQVQADQLPQPLIAESDGKDETYHQDITGSNSTAPADAGVLDVSATTAPSGAASTQGAALSIAGLVTISGATTQAAGGVVGGVARDVTAAAFIGSITLAGGAVVLGDVAESVHQRTGAGATSAGSFSVGSLTIGGLPLPVDASQLATSLAAANAALATTGVHLTVPVFAQASDGTATMSPLEIGITNSELGHELVAPLVGDAQPVRDELEGELVSANCQTGNAFSIGDLVLGAATGAGSLNLDVGGLSATSEGTYYPSPFGTFGLSGVGAETLGSGLVGTAATPATAGHPANRGTSLPTAGRAAAASAPQAAAPVAARTVSLLGTLCQTTHLYAHTSCRADWALPVGLGALGVIGGLAYGDAMRGGGRRLGRRRGLPQGRRGLAKLKL
jgi:hypothetical protein